MLDYAVIGPRLQTLYDWSAKELEHPGLSELIHDGAPGLRLPYGERRARDAPPLPLAAEVLRLATSPRASRSARGRS